MQKIWAIAAVMVLSVFQQSDKFTFKVSGMQGSAHGIVVAGTEYVSLKETADLLEGKLTTARTDEGDKEVTMALGAPKAGFNDEPDTTIPVDGNTSAWQTLANSNGAIRLREFTRAKDSWNLVGEMEVARQSVFAEGRVPRGPMILNVYAVSRDSDDKAIDRYTAQVKDVSFDGGRYKITINTENPTGHLPATVGLRFNFALDTVGNG